MDDTTVRVTLSLIGPGILSVFGTTFVWAWAIERRRHYLLLIAGACFLFALGATCQIFYWPPDTGLNAMISGALYTVAVLAAVEGILRRSGRRFGLTLDIAVFLVLTGLLWYFFYVERNLLARVYVQNFGYGLILLAAALRLIPLARGRRVDRALFWILLLFAVQFFPRTVLTIGLSAPPDAKAFAVSLFWQVLQLSLAVLGAGLAFAVLAAAFTDLIEDLRRERDFDRLTGVLNRRGFDEHATAAFAREAGRPLSLLVCDLDRFKSINDRFGHDAGDEVLRTFGEMLRKTAPAGAVVGRIGGEEFAVLLAGARRAEVNALAEQLRGETGRMTFRFLPAGERVTLSLGVAERKPTDRLEHLIRRADARLYRAKSAGRDRVVARDEVRPPPKGEEAIEPLRPRSATA